MPTVLPPPLCVSTDVVWLPRLRSNSEAAGHKTRMGFNLIEAAIVLGVVGLVLGGIWYAASAVSDTLKVNQTISGIALFNADLQKTLSGVNSGSAIIPISIFSNIPTGWEAAGNYGVKSPHGGIFAFHLQTTGSDTYFTIRLISMEPKSFSDKVLPSVFAMPNLIYVHFMEDTGFERIVWNGHDPGRGHYCSAATCRWVAGLNIR